MEEVLEQKNKLNKILSKITEIYIFLIIVIFPLCVDSTGFFKILECKYRCYLFMATIYLVTNIALLAYYYIFYKVNYFKERKLNKIQYAVIIFWIINIISCFTSPFFKEYNLFVGVGRRRRINKYIFILFVFFSNYIIWKIS